MELKAGCDYWMSYNTRIQDNKLRFELRAAVFGKDMARGHSKPAPPGETI
jgi:hypothetical protein